MSAGSALLAFSLAVFVFHQLPSLVPERALDWVDLVTPLAVLTCAALVLRRDAATPALVAAALGAVLYTDGHGIHLAANSIRQEPLGGHAADVAIFWDEEWGHFEWHLGWFVLMLGFCLAERWRRARIGRLQGVLCGLLLGWTLFATTVEGRTWWLELAATAFFVPWAAAGRRPLLITCASGFALAALLIGVWAIWQGGVPEFSDVGYL